MAYFNKSQLYLDVPVNLGKSENVVKSFRSAASDVDSVNIDVGDFPIGCICGSVTVYLTIPGSGSIWGGSQHSVNKVVINLGGTYRSKFSFALSSTDVSLQEVCQDKDSEGNPTRFEGHRDDTTYTIVRDFSNYIRIS